MRHWHLIRLNLLNFIDPNFSAQFECRHENADKLKKASSSGLKLLFYFSNRQKNDYTSGNYIKKYLSTMSIFYIRDEPLRYLFEQHWKASRLKYN